MTQTSVHLFNIKKKGKEKVSNRIQTTTSKEWSGHEVIDHWLTTTNI